MKARASRPIRVEVSGTVNPVQADRDPGHDDRVHVAHHGDPALDSRSAKTGPAVRKTVSDRWAAPSQFFA